MAGREFQIGMHHLAKNQWAGMMKDGSGARQGPVKAGFQPTLPEWTSGPKSAKGARDKQHEDICHICRRNLIHVPCSATLIYYQYVNDAGVSQAALDQQVRQNPQASAQQLRAGAGASQISIGEIAPILLNSRKARHEVEKSKSFSSLKESFETPWIVKADLLDRQFICMQTPFMHDVLLRDSVQSWHTENLEPESGRHGIITDGTHDFFKEGVLLTSLVFSQVVLRWVVVLYTWIGRQNVDHHTPHFSQLVNVIAEICAAGLGYTFDDQLFSAILDFSNAQRNGFIEAFMSEDERFITANSQEHQKSSKRPSEAIRPPGSNLLQSYSWDANSCFIDAPLEAYFWAFGCMSDAVRAEFLRRIRTEAADTAGLRDIMEHFGSGGFSAVQFLLQDTLR
ncbi:hypothetical protein C8J57DRAFT_1520833 [Mycena rebaudengoi]|nr:hypothetical protein C8J57DRAFT_1520833 [Mycena rebaudengoi]